MTDPTTFNGLVYGLKVFAQSVPNLTVNVTSGGIVADGVLRISAGNSALTIPTPDAAFNRWDWIAVSKTTGAVSIISGTLGDVGPDWSILTGYIPSGYVFVGAGVTSVTNANITMLEQTDLPLPAQTWAYTYLSGAQSAVDPGAGNYGFNSAQNSLTTHIYVSCTNGQASGGGIGGFAQGMNQWLLQASLIGPFYLRIWSQQDPTIWQLWRVDSATASSAWADLAVTFIRQANASINAPQQSTASLDSIFEFAGFVAGTPTLPSGMTSLAADVTMSTSGTFYDGPNTGAIGSGVERYLILATVSFNLVTATRVTVRITDGTTIYAETETTFASNTPSQVTLHAIVASTGAQTFKVTAAPNGSSASSKMKAQTVDSPSGSNIATSISYLRIA